MLESQLEKEFVRLVSRKFSGVALKLKHNGAHPGFPRRGIQDRWCLLPGGVLVPVELKRPDGTGRVSPTQAIWERNMSALGFECFCSNDLEYLDECFTRITTADF